MTDEIPFSSGIGEEERRVHSFEIVVSQTCSHFRNVALATPRLWSSIYVDATRRIDHIAQDVARSGVCWLDIRIDVGVQDLQMNDQNLEAMMDLLTPHSRRWRSLSIACGCERVDYPVVGRLCNSSAPGLQQLSITVDDVDRPNATMVSANVNYPHIFKDGTPRLAFVRLRGMALSFYRPHLNFVTTLHLDHTRKSLLVPYSTFLDIVTCSPFLENLSLHGDIIAPSSWPAGNRPIQIPNLRSLRIFGEAEHIYSGILLGIQASTLESLTLKDMKNPDLDTLWNMADSSWYARLSRLTLVDFELSLPIYERVFLTFQNITTIYALQSTVSESPLIRLLLEGRLGGPNGPYIPWPRLKTMAFSYDAYGSDEALIERVVETRREQGCPLSKLRLGVDYEEMEEDPPQAIDVGDDIEIEFFWQAELWPENRTFFDHDDGLFI
ncbi:hypothetical protein M413DRAFT_442051 [Hebeloma cylindrosporum]|uniref:F-box domain-containing protein n=1 Tax=Hebeloma cylindrosporum TaxID=76867 RepID=A0A0C2YWK7_HEBCY|nr:hypothetical protein M413DRAFT_442051 [Hebeloma cylindrosporum h7]